MGWFKVSRSKAISIAVSKFFSNKGYDLLWSDASIADGRCILAYIQLTMSGKLTVGRIEHNLETKQFSVDGGPLQPFTDEMLDLNLEDPNIAEKQGMFVGLESTQESGEGKVLGFTDSAVARKSLFSRKSFDISFLKMKDLKLLQPDQESEDPKGRAITEMIKNRGGGNMRLCAGTQNPADYIASVTKKFPPNEARTVIEKFEEELKAAIEKRKMQLMKKKEKRGQGSKKGGCFRMFRK